MKVITTMVGYGNRDFTKNGSKKGTFEIYQKNGQLMKKVYINMENLNEGNVRTKS